MADTGTNAKVSVILYVWCSEDDGPPIYKKIKALKVFKNVSDDLLVVELKGFVREHGEKPGLRMKPLYFDPSHKDIKMHTLDLMKQAIYGTQMRLKDLDPVIAKYNKSVPFQMAFVYSRLEQLIVDMRRIYTLAMRQRDTKRVYQHILLYEHLASKHVDVLYLVEFVIDTHTVAMRSVSILMKPQRD